MSSEPQPAPSGPRRLHRAGILVLGVDALRDAQLDLLRDKTEGFQSPAFWAPFVVIGGASPAATKRGGS